MAIEELNVINLDELIPESTFVVLDKTKHEVISPTVEMYVKILKSQRGLRNANSDVEQVEQAVELIHLCCPSITKDRLRSLPMVVLNRLTKVIDEKMGVEDAVEGQENQETGE